MGLNLPNLITIFRIFMVPLIVWLIISGQFFIAFLLFVLAGMSDGIDGFIAKRFNQTTELGAYLDPIADKLLLVSIYVSLGFGEILPPWLVILVVSPRYPDCRSPCVIMAYGATGSDYTAYGEQGQYDRSDRAGGPGARRTGLRH